MKNTEFRRLMGYFKAAQTHRIHQSRSAPSKRSAKNPSTNKVYKNSRVVAAPVERLFTSNYNTKSLNPDFYAHKAT